MRTVVFTLLLAAVIPAALAAPHLGVLGYYWLSYMAPHQIDWGGPPIPWAMVFAVTTIAAWMMSREPKKVPMSGIMIILLIFFAWTTFTLPFAMFADAAFEKWNAFMKVVIMAVVTISLMNTRERLHALIWIVVISLGYYTVKGGLFVLATAGAYQVLGPPKTAFFSTNGAARMAIMVMPLMFYLYLHSANRFVRIVMAAAVILSVLTLIGTGSRGGFLAFVAMAFVFWLYSRHKIRLALAGATLLVIGGLVVPTERLEQWTGRISTIEKYEEEATAISRFDAWRWGWNLAVDRPITGGGFAAYLGNRYPTKDGGSFYRESHSNYFEVLGEHGFPGLFLYLLLGATVYVSAWRTARIARNRPDLYWARDLATMLQIALVGYFVGGLTINDSFLELYYTLVSMVVITGILVRRELSATREAAKVPVRPMPRPAVAAPMRRVARRGAGSD